jgi:predicted ATPase/class 3 adenylate cyclase
MRQSSSGVACPGSSFSRMRDLPSGTVTFLFTDIEGSTKLLQELGDGYAEALAGHRQVLRRAFADHGGTEVDTQGDAFLVAFARATDAVAAAADAQRALAEGSIRVRMGVHTGEPIRTDEGYAGMDVHRGARIAAAGHGGQVLISQTSHDLVEQDLPDELALRDLGAHRLKDLTSAQRIFQLLADGLDREFPPLTTLDNRPTNLPPQPTALIGREQELADVVDLLRRPHLRLLTLTGPGGAGKTRLALQAAADLLEDFSDGAFFVALAGTVDSSLVLGTIGQALGVKESGGRSMAEAVADFLRNRKLLLVLDNFEHVADAAPEIIELVLQGMSLKALVSSRAALRVSGEHEYSVPELAETDGIALFSERARAIKPDFQLNGDALAVAEICRRLDGLPLAIELAAARARVLSPTALLERLEERLPVLTGGARDLPDRQRTLRDTIAWSYELLDESEQKLFSRLAVFRASFTLEAAETICEADLDTLTSLVEKSLVRHVEGRFRMLETIREYAHECLQVSGDLERTRRQHLDFFLALAEVAGADLEQERRTSTWLELLELEHDNCRAGLEAARELGERRLELRLASALASFWQGRSYFDEGRTRITEALARDPDAPLSLRGPILRHSALMAHKQGDFKTARVLTEEAAAGHRATGNSQGLAQSLNLLGVVSMGEGDLDEAKALLEQSHTIREQIGDEIGIHASLHNLGLVALEQGDFSEARSKLEAALAGARKGRFEQRIANGLADLGFAVLGQAGHEEARVVFAEALRQASRLGWKENVAYALIGLAAVATDLDDLEQAARLLGQAESLGEEIHLNLERYAVTVRDRTRRELASRLDPDRFAACFKEGRSAPFEDVVSLALSDAD